MKVFFYDRTDVRSGPAMTCLTVYLIAYINICRHTYTLRQYPFMSDTVKLPYLPCAVRCSYDSKGFEGLKKIKVWTALSVVNFTTKVQLEIATIHCIEYIFRHVCNIWIFRFYCCLTHINCVNYSYRLSVFRLIHYTPCITKKYYQKIRNKPVRGEKRVLFNK